MARARKPWSELSASYRARLERSGVTPEAHRAGVNIRRASGKTSPGTVSLSGPDVEAGRNAGMSNTQISVVRQTVTHIKELWQRGDRDKASQIHARMNALFAEKGIDIPKQLMYYHEN